MIHESRRQWLRHAGVTATALSAAALTGCGAFGSGRGAPPPYPVLRRGTDAGASSRGSSRAPGRESSRASRASGSPQWPWRQAWKGQGAGRGHAGLRAAEAGDTIWVPSSNDGIAALDVATGVRRRVIARRTPISGGVAADEQAVVAVTREARIVAFDADGTTLWESALPGESVSPPVLTTSLAVVRLLDGRVVAFERDGGAQRWIFQRPSGNLVLRQPASPVHQDGLLYSGMPGARLVAIDPLSGVAAWENIVATPRGATELERLVDLVGDPAISGSDICAISYQGKVACIHREDGRTAWQRDMGSSVGLAADRRIVVTVDNGDVVVAMQAASGEVKWKQDGYVRRDLTRPAIVQDRVVFGDRNGQLHALDADTGAPVGRQPVDGSPILGAVQSFGERLMAVSRNGTVVAFDLASSDPAASTEPTETPDGAR